VLPLVLLAVFALREDQTPYMSRPVATGHQLFQDDCGKCHQTAWQPAMRLTRLDNDVRSVRDADCQTCHVQSTNDHYHRPLALTAPACATCHLEHRGANLLSEVSDAFCVSCHGWTMQTVSPEWPTGIDSFARHPEFEIHRLKATDETQLKFSHAGHLKPLLAPLTKDDAATDAPQQVKLTCHDCHQPDSAGQYMRSIVYEDHCSRCHPLRFTGKTDSSQPLPHEDVEVVYGVLRDRLMDYARAHPDEVQRGTDMGASRLPNKLNELPPSVKDEWEWVEAELQTLRGDVFFNPLKNGCLKCHTTDKPSSDVGGLTDVQGWLNPTRIPDRWLPHSHFDHGRHTEVACTVCHYTPGTSTDALRTQETPIMLESKVVQDVLMPGIEVCRQCHGPSSAQPRGGSARSGCIECHVYHRSDAATHADGHTLRALLPADRIKQ
jgi:predicted CXXCH cytochrome family protein